MDISRQLKMVPTNAEDFVGKALYQSERYGACSAEESDES